MLILALVVAFGKFICVALVCLAEVEKKQVQCNSPTPPQKHYNHCSSPKDIAVLPDWIPRMQIKRVEVSFENFLFSLFTFFKHSQLQLKLYDVAQCAH